jgi:translation initiation factor IF-3
MNDRIRVPRVNLVDENGKVLGEMPTLRALEIAREREYDLVEVSAQTRPPVCKLHDHSRRNVRPKAKSSRSSEK